MQEAYLHVAPDAISLATMKNISAAHDNYARDTVNQNSDGNLNNYSIVDYAESREETEPQYSIITSKEKKFNKGSFMQTMTHENKEESPYATMN